jgi:hypothetical protein
MIVHASGIFDEASRAVKRAAGHTFRTQDR